MRCCLKSELLIIVPPTVASISDAVNTVSVAKTTAAVGETVTDIVTFGDSYTPTFALSGNNGTLSAPRKTAIRGRTPTPSPAEIPAFRLLPPLPTPPQATLPHPMLHEFDVLLVFMFDRLGRREDETPFVVQWFVQQGIEVWSTKEGEQRFDNHVDKLLNYIRFWQASGESEKTSIRVKTRLAQMTQDGQYTGGLVPYGYRLEYLGRINKKNQPVRDLVIDEEEAAVVREIFRLLADEG